MGDNVVVSAGTGTTIAADEITDVTLGTCKVGYVKLMDGTLDGTNKAAVGTNGLSVDVKASILPSGAASATNQTSGNQKTQIVDGSGSVVGSTGNALDVNIKTGVITNLVSAPVFTRETAGTFSYGQVSVTSSATTIATSNTNRQRLVIIQAGTTDVYIGNASVTTSNGVLLAGTKGNQLLIKADDAVFGITATGSQAVSFLEESVI